MKILYRLLTVALALIISLGVLQSCSKDVENTSVQDKAAIETLLKSYREALNNSDADKVVQLFTNNGVLFANAAPTAEGSAAVKGTYQYIFANYAYTLQFSIIEIVVEGSTAFARSTSKGSFVIKASGQTVPDVNRELFVFEKADGQWKIARYMYNKDQ